MPENKFHLVVPLDASGVTEFTPDQLVKVVIQLTDGSILEQVAKFGQDGKSELDFGFAAAPGVAHVLVGPPEATAEELLKMETIRVNVPTRLWLGKPRLALQPIKIAPYYWNWWRIWCKTYTIRGKVICPNGRPVPGATVNAYDIDWWFWWTSRQFVGSAVTDENGAFEIQFRWCCIFWPPWWWLHRVWEIDPWLVKRIQPVLQRKPDLVLGRVDNLPSLGVFSRLLEREGKILTRPLQAEDATTLEKVRPALLQKLPAAPELEKLMIWPWYPWAPWRDCVPDIIFKITQDTITPGTVIYQEGVGDTRWNIPNPLNVTLTANDKAWCLPGDGDGEGQCLVFTQVCNDPVDDVGGNLGAPLQPAGYLYPGATPAGTIGYSGDRPFAGSVVVEKNTGDFHNVDYYEIEYVNEIDRAECGAAWSPLPANWAADFYRHWMQILPPPGPMLPPIVHTGDVLFNWQLIDGHRVVESREHSEANGGLAGWDVSRWWLYNRDVVMVLDSPHFPDGTYRFRVVGYQKDAANHLVNKTYLPYCNTKVEASLVLTFDNRLNPDPAHPPSTPSHPCTIIHACITEPDTDFISVKIGGNEVGACQVVNLDPQANLEIEFMVTHPLFTRFPCAGQAPETTGGHLAYYELYSEYGENLAVNLLAHATSVVAVSPATAAPGWASADPYGSYGRALAQGAAAPHWEGGTYRLTIPVSVAFPEPCCYQLVLSAHTRPVTGCDHNFQYYNTSTYTIGVGVCPPK